MLRFGIVGFKYNYKNNKFRKIVIQLSFDLKKIIYQDIKETKSVFNGQSNVKLIKFKSVIYGGITDNFKKHRRVLRRKYEMDANPSEASRSSFNSAYFKREEECWQPWKCVSLVNANGKTIDFTIGEENSMMAFIHVFYKLIYEPPIDVKFLRDFKISKIKMKLNYEAS